MIDTLVNKTLAEAFDYIKVSQAYDLPLRHAFKILYIEKRSEAINNAYRYRSLK